MHKLVSVLGVLALATACNLASGDDTDPNAVTELPANGRGANGGGAPTPPGGDASSTRDAGVPTGASSSGGASGSSGTGSTSSGGGSSGWTEPTGSYDLFGSVGELGEFGPLSCATLGAVVNFSDNGPGLYFDSRECDPGAPLRYELLVLFPGAQGGRVPDSSVNFDLPDGCLETFISVHVTGLDWTADYGGNAAVFTRPECPSNAGSDAGSGGDAGAGVRIAAGNLSVSRFDAAAGSFSLQLSSITLVRAAVSGNAPASLPTELTSLFAMAESYR